MPHHVGPQLQPGLLIEMQPRDIFGISVTLSEKL